MNKFYVLVGSNINPHENVNKGLDLIKKNNEIVLEAVSSEYTSKAVGMDGNAVSYTHLTLPTKQPV